MIDLFHALIYACPPWLGMLKWIKHYNGNSTYPTPKIKSADIQRKKHINDLSLHIKTIYRNLEKLNYISKTSKHIMMLRKENQVRSTPYEVLSVWCVLYGAVYVLYGQRDDAWRGAITHHGVGLPCDTNKKPFTLFTLILLLFTNYFLYTVILLFIIFLYCTFVFITLHLPLSCIYIYITVRK